MSAALNDRVDRLVVETSGLTKTFGDRSRWTAPTCGFRPGVAFGFLGPNGAGKTTLIRVLLGLTPATRGEMRLLGMPVPERRGDALKRVGAIVEEPSFHGHLTGRQNLRIAAACREPDAHGRIQGSLVGPSGPGGDAATALHVSRFCGHRRAHCVDPDSAGRRPPAAGARSHATRETGRPKLGEGTAWCSGCAWF